MLLARDIVAAAVLLWISFTAWNEQITDSSIAASVRLAFYIPRSETVLLPAVLDVDGDGTPEALAMWRATSVSMTETSWRVQIADLRPSLSSQSSLSISPFLPKVILESEDLRGETIYIVPTEDMTFRPLQMITGQVLTTKARLGPKKNAFSQPAERSSSYANRTLRYFCGKDWHDAAQRCAVHCPSGQPKDCPENESCFADTPCSATDPKLVDTPIYNPIDLLHTTPAGGWPSIFTVWSQGRITMHSLSAETVAVNATDKKAKTTKQPPLRVILLWDVSPLHTTLDGNGTKVVELEDVALAFVDALSAPTDHGNNAGILVVSGTVTVYHKENDNPDDEYLETTATFAVALDALTGETLWRSSSSNELENALSVKKNDAVVLPVVLSRGSTSAARRRSMIPGLDPPKLNAQRSGEGPSGTSTVNCMKEYRRSLLTSGALPYQYWGTDEDSTIAALHFDHQSGGSSRDHHSGHHHVAKKAKSSTAHYSRKESPSFGKTKRGKQKHHKALLKYGRPNVIVTHNHEGIQVRALRNGRPLCHLSLQDQTLYADINHDGTLDSLQVVTSNSHSSLLSHSDDDAVMEERKWLKNLALKITKLNNISDSVEDADLLSEKLMQTPLCHIMALSGLPSREELFSVNLCAGGSGKNDVHGAAQAAAKQIELQGAPLLLVERIGYENSHGHDVVAAVNTGTVTRFQGNNGRRVWQLDEKRQKGTIFPTWDDPYYVVLSRIDSDKVILSNRPIVLMGQNSVILIAASSGHLLGSATFPQPSDRRPQLVDLNGDGTTDILVSTSDAIWGYHVVVRTGTSIPFRILVGLLIMALMLALLRNRFGPQPGKRSSDQ